jgi:hypothetical protein
VTVSNITFNGVDGAPATSQAAFFDGTNCNVGMTEGIFLGSGSIGVAVARMITAARPCRTILASGWTFLATPISI